MIRKDNNIEYSANQEGTPLRWILRERGVLNSWIKEITSKNETNIFFSSSKKVYVDDKGSGLRINLGLAVLFYSDL